MINYKLYLFGLLLTLLMSSCQEPLPLIDNLNQGRIEALGHGGMGVRSLLYPFNSYASIENCFEAGAAGTELDVQLTADDQLVVLHNELLESNTNGEGRAIQHPLRELTPLIYDFPSLRDFFVTDLESVVELAANSHILMLDCKTYYGEMDQEIYMKRFAQAIHRLVLDHDLLSTLIVESRDSSLLMAVKQINPEIRTFYQPWDLESGKRFVLRHDMYGISLPLDRSDSSYIRGLHEAGIRVAIFGTNTRSKNLQAISLSPEYIQTDRVSHLVDLLAE